VEEVAEAVELAAEAVEAVKAACRE